VSGKIIGAERKRIFRETQKDFFEQKPDLYFCNMKTAHGHRKSKDLDFFISKAK
jgi:hypothetical protein